MNKGFVICDGEYYVSEEVGIDWWIAEHTTYESAEDAYEDEYYYYTEWEDEDDYDFEDEESDLSTQSVNWKRLKVSNEITTCDVKNHH